MIEKFIEKRILDTYQSDRYGFIRPVILMNELQSLADKHAEFLGFGRTFCIENNIAWVVTHYLIDIIELPREGEELTFITWPSSVGTLKACRDFEIRGYDNRILINATSQWVLIDTQRRRPVKLSDYMDMNIISERSLNREFGHFPEFKSEKSHIYKCRFDDVDVNQHINNAAYAVWATESVGFEYRNTHKLKGIELNFKKEISPNTPEVKIDVEIVDNESHHRIITDDFVHADVICKWELL